MGVSEPAVEELRSLPWAPLGAMACLSHGEAWRQHLCWLSGLRANAFARPSMAQDLSSPGLPGFGGYLQPGCPALESGRDTIQGEALLGRLPKG